MSADPLAPVGGLRRWGASALIAVAVHAAPAAATLAGMSRATTIWEDAGIPVVTAVADEAEAAEQSDSEVESADQDASQATPEVKKTLSAQSPDDLPETDASPKRPDDPELQLAEKKTVERQEDSSEQQTTEEMAPSESVADAAASQAAPPPSPIEATASITAAPAEGSVREAPPTPASWQKAVMAHLGRHKRYPADARARGDEGDVQVAITIGRDGRVLSRRLHRSGGAGLLDRAALDLVDRAGPLPALPANFLADRVEVVVPIRYRLTS